LISLDWSNAKDYWFNNVNKNLSTCESTNTQNALLIKQSSPGTKVFIYHNTELALQWLESQRAVMYDPSKSNWFLQYTDGKGKKNGTIYNEPIIYGDQYFWDFRVPEASKYFVDSILQSIKNLYVDGTFADDVTGLPEEHGEAIKNMHISPQEANEIQQATQIAVQNLIDTLIENGKYVYQAFSAEDDVGPAPTKSNCIQFMEKFCEPDMQKNPMTMSFNTKDTAQVLAAFLITRPPYGWLGFGWESDMKNWSPMFNLDVGVPRGLCEQKQKGVFSRDWSKGSAELDCNTWQASLIF